MQLRRSHGRQAISCVTVKNQTNHEVMFWTTGRDGCYIQYRLVRKNNENSNTNIPKATDDDDEEEEEEHVMKSGIASQGDTMIETSGWILEKIYRNKVTKGWLEGALWIDDELLLLGFYRKRFFVYNETKTFEVKQKT